MERQKIFTPLSLGYKNIVFFISLIFLPNLLGLFNISVPGGFKIHFFQAAIFMAALLYGPKGGALAGGVGSLYSAFSMGNPYIIIGNVLLGFFTGFFARLGLPILLAVIFSFCIQLPWLIISDYYFVNLPVSLIKKIILALALSNILWAIVVYYIIKPIKRIIKNDSVS